MPSPSTISRASGSSAARRRATPNSTTRRASRSTTGPLGQGVGNAVGLAIAEAQLAATYNREQKIVDHHTYCIAGDGDLMEGVSSEASSLAGHLKLGKLIVLYDDNKISLAGPTDLTFTEDVCARYAAYGWHVAEVEADDGNDVNGIDAAIIAAKDDPRPSLIAVRTIIGFGSPRANTFGAHGEPLGAENVKKTKEALGWPVEPDFYVPDDVLAWWRELGTKGATTQKAWDATYAQWTKRESRSRRATRAHSRRALARAHRVAVVRRAKRQRRDARGGRHRHERDRERSARTRRAVPPTSILRRRRTSKASATSVRAIARAATSTSACANTRWARSPTASSVHSGILPFTATFFNFLDYMKPAVRLAALNNSRAIFIFTHDSVFLGEDGPTHQPIEQLASCVRCRT